MRALTRYNYGGPEELRLETLPDPTPQKGQVAVRVLACGVNLSDWEGLTGRPLYARIGGFRRPAQPILGSDIVGEITALGADVDGWNIGQKVWADVVTDGAGGFASHVVLPTKNLAALAQALDPVIAAALPQSGGIALAATKTLQPGQRLLVNGAGGGSGSLILQLARKAGAEVSGVDTAAKVDLMAQMGAQHTIDYRTTDFTQTGQTWDHIVDLVASRPAWKVRKALTDRGRYVLFGGTVPAMLSALITPKCAVGMAEGTPDVLGRLAELVINQTITPQIASVMPLSKAAEAITLVGTGKALGKIVVVPD